jgi:hypothetical protein
MQCHGPPPRRSHWCHSAPRHAFGASESQIRGASIRNSPIFHEPTIAAVRLIYGGLSRSLHERVIKSRHCPQDGGSVNG